MATEAQTILKDRPPGPMRNLTQAMAWVAATQGKGRARQLREIAALVLGRTRLQPADYYRYALFRQSISPATRRSYVSQATSDRLNSRLSPPSAQAMHGLIVNKVLTGFLLHQAGFPVLPTLALFSDRMRVPNLKHLADATDIAAHLGGEAALPCFGKPLDSSHGIGAASLMSLSQDRKSIALGDGRTVDLMALCTEIARLYSAGYMFQPLIRQHLDALAVNGPAAGTLRIVTLRTGGEPVHLYTVLRMPGPNAMIDTAPPGSTSGYALINPQSGRILRAQDRRRFCTTPLLNSLATDLPLQDYRLPFVPEAIRLAQDIHQMFPGHGVLGCDIALTETGPVVTEVNTNPFHTLYQIAADRGLLNPDFLPLLRAAETEVQRVNRAAS